MPTFLPADEFVIGRGLMTSEQIAMPFKDGEVYEPFQEPYWMELKAAMRPPHAR